MGTLFKQNFSLDSLGGGLATAGKICCKVELSEMLLRSLKVLNGAEFLRVNAFVGVESNTLTVHAFVFAVARVHDSGKVYLAYTDSETLSPKAFPMVSETHAKQAEQKLRDFFASKGLVDFYEALKNADSKEA